MKITYKGHSWGTKNSLLERIASLGEVREQIRKTLKNVKT